MHTLLMTFNFFFGYRFAYKLHKEADEAGAFRVLVAKGYPLTRAYREFKLAPIFGIIMTASVFAGFFITSSVFGANSGDVKNMEIFRNTIIKLST